MLSSLYCQICWFCISTILLSKVHDYTERTKIVKIFERLKDRFYLCLVFPKEHCINLQLQFTWQNYNTIFKRNILLTGTTIHCVLLNAVWKARSYYNYSKIICQWNLLTEINNSWLCSFCFSWSGTFRRRWTRLLSIISRKVSWSETMEASSKLLIILQIEITN